MLQLGPWLEQVRRNLEFFQQFYVAAVNLPSFGRVLPGDIFLLSRIGRQVVELDRFIAARCTACSSPARL